MNQPITIDKARVDSSPIKYKALEYKVDYPTGPPRSHPEGISSTASGSLNNQFRTREVPVGVSRTDEDFEAVRVIDDPTLDQ